MYQAAAADVALGNIGVVRFRTVIYCLLVLSHEIGNDFSVKRDSSRSVQ